MAECILSPVNTTFNDNEAAYLYTGIMFSIRTKTKSIEITTLELDVNLAAAGSASSSLDVQVYTIKDGYSGVINDPSAWTLAAQTVGVAIPGGGGLLIPVQDFTPIAVAADELRSLYVTMTGPYLDNRASGLDGMGDLDQDFDAFRLDVGAGLTGTVAFPSTGFDTTTHPKFAGVVHFVDTSSECNVVSASVSETFIEYKFLIDDAGMDEDDMLDEINTAVQDFFISELESADGYLKDYASTYSLIQGDGSPSSSTGGRQTTGCPDTFVACMELSTAMKFEHRSVLDSGDLLYRLYTMADTLRTHIFDVTAKNILYSGPRDTSATFKLLLQGVPSGTEMNDEQRDFFETSIKTFIDSVVTEPIFSVDVTTQTVQEGASLSATLELVGEIRGAQENYALDQLFADNVESALVNYKDGVVQGLAFNVLRPPSTLNKENAAFFRGIDGLESHIDAVIRAPSSSTASTDIGAGADAAATIVPATSPTTAITDAASDDSNITLFVIGVIVILLLGVLIFLYRFFFGAADTTSDGSTTVPSQRKKSGAGKEHAKLMAESRDPECAPDSDGNGNGNGNGGSQRNNLTKQSSSTRAGMMDKKQMSVRSSDNGNKRSFMDKQASTRSTGSNTSRSKPPPPFKRSQSVDELPPAGRALSRAQSGQIQNAPRRKSSDASDSEPAAVGGNGGGRRPPPRSQSSDGASADLQPLQPLGPAITGGRRPPPPRSKSSDGASADLQPLQRPPLPERRKSSDGSPPVESSKAGAAASAAAPPNGGGRRPPPMRSKSSDCIGHELQPLQRPSNGPLSQQAPPERRKSSDGADATTMPPLPPGGSRRPPPPRSKSSDGSSADFQPLQRPQPLARTKSFDGSGGGGDNRPPQVPSRAAEQPDGRRKPPMRSKSFDGTSLSGPPPTQRPVGTSAASLAPDTRRPAPARHASSDALPRGGRSVDMAPQPPRRGRRRERNPDDNTMDTDSPSTDGARAMYKRSQSDENLLDKIKSGPSSAPGPPPPPPGRGTPKRTPSLRVPNAPNGQAPPKPNGPAPPGQRGPPPNAPQRQASVRPNGQPVMQRDASARSVDSAKSNNGPLPSHNRGPPNQPNRRVGAGPTPPASASGGQR